jgi:hypothetical protein
MTDTPQNRHKGISPTWYVILAASPVFFAHSLLAESLQDTQSPQVQIKTLTDRVASLEQRLAKLEKKVAFDEDNKTYIQQADSAKPGGANIDPKTDSPSKETRASADNSGSGLLQMPGQKGASMSRQANAFPNSPSSKIGTKVVAPFFVTDSDGNIIMVVDAPAKGTVSGLTIYNPDGSFVQVGPGQSGFSGVRVYDGRVGAAARAFMGLLENSRPGFALAKADGSLSTGISTSGENAEMDFYNSSGKVAAVIGANPENGEGHAIFKDAGGTTLARIGAAGTHGDVILEGDGNRIPVWEFTLVGVR